MSIKTLKKRIALVAVSTLTAGVLSAVATAPAANATATLATSNLASAVTTIGSEASVGLITSSGTGTTGTAVLISTGTLVVKGAAVSSKYKAMSVTGGTISAATMDTTATGYTINASMTYVYAGTANKALSAAFRPASGVSSMTIQIFDNDAASTTSGTLVGQYVVTIATTSASGAYSPTYSGVNTVVNDASDATNVDGIDEADSTSIASGGVGLINYTLKDAYGVELPATGAIVISASAGGLVAFNGTVGTETALASIPNITAVTNDASGTISVAQPDATKPLTTTVTISYNGVVVGSKTLTFAGHVAKVVVDSNLVSQAGGSRTDQFRVKYYDAAGTRLYPSDDTFMTTLVSGTSNAFITGASVATTGVAATQAAAKGTVACAGTAATGAGSGSANLQLQYVTSTGAKVLSNVWKHTCAGDAVTYKASFDKATYTPGSIATLTVTGLDALGNPTHAASNNIAGSGNPITCVGCPNANTAVTAPTDADVAGGRDSGNPAGSVTYKYVVGTTLGDFVAVVEAEEVSADALGLASKQTVSYSVKESTSTVTNAEVLKSIVALIASINKQIQALQKLILKR